MQPSRHALDSLACLELLGGEEAQAAGGAVHGAAHRLGARHAAAKRRTAQQLQLRQPWAARSGRLRLQAAGSAGPLGLPCCAAVPSALLCCLLRLLQRRQVLRADRVRGGELARSAARLLAGAARRLAGAAGRGQVGAGAAAGTAAAQRRLRCRRGAAWPSSQRRLPCPPRLPPPPRPPRCEAGGRSWAAPAHPTPSPAGRLAMQRAGCGRRHGARARRPTP